MMVEAIPMRTMRRIAAHLITLWVSGWSAVEGGTCCEVGVEGMVEIVSPEWEKELKFVQWRCGKGLLELGQRKEWGIHIAS